MLDVDQNYGTPETPKPFPTFKECVAQDVQNVIFNSNEFAEERYIDDKLKLTDAVNGMNTNIKLTIQQLENTNKSLEIVTAQNKKQDDRLTALEKAPGTFGNKLWWAVIAALVSGLVAYELTMLLH